MGLVARMAAVVSGRSEAALDPAALGLAGEERARRYLERRGYLTLARRYRARGAEIDLIMQDGEAIVFVEVKTRRVLRAGAPAESVTASKTRQIAAAAQCFLKAERLLHRAYRFDVVAVSFSPKGRPRIEHLRDAAIAC